MQLLIGLGGNLGDPSVAFRTALAALTTTHPVVTVSGLYRSAPHGPPQPRYWNMAAVIEIRAPLLEVLGECQHLERQAGREPSCGQRWGPRPLDVDLLLAQRVVHRGPHLELPHPRLLERGFALMPAAEIAPSWRHPLSGRTLGDLARAAAGFDPTLRRVDDHDSRVLDDDRPVSPDG